MDKRNPFPDLLKFLSRQRRTIEYISADLTANISVKLKAEANNESCCSHKSSTHNTASSSVYLGKSNVEKVNVIRENGAC